MPTAMYRNIGHSYVKECTNVCETTSWRCHTSLQMKCKARLVTSRSEKDNVL